MNIVLIGYMASGKSTIGKLLAKTLKFQLIDLDDYIEKKEKETISDIFKNKGEIYFRKTEHIYLKEILEIDINKVISLGGGTPCYSGNIELIKSSRNVKSIYLKASVKELTNRLINEKLHRPLVSRLKTKKELTDFIGKHLFERNHFYNQADISIVIDDKTIEAIQEELLIKLYQ